MTRGLPLTAIWKLCHFGRGGFGARPAMSLHQGNRSGTVCAGSPTLSPSPHRR